MKHLVFLMSLFGASSAYAGPNWQVIKHHNKKAKVELLDHGPRALTTPYVEKVLRGNEL